MLNKQIMLNKQNKKSRHGVELCAIVFCIVALGGCGGGNENFLSQQGFISPPTPVLLYDAPAGLLGEQHYIVMNLTTVRAKVLLKKFRTLKSTSDPNAAPKQMPVASTPNALWKPQTVKKYWAGGFRTGTSGNPDDPKKYPYHCKYVFDVGKPGTVVLYFYAVSAYN